ncbi:MAG TPA: succinate dehydrogenase [Stellaceae bacterium]|nr:succinate dehydrogenase [Stellaceae bacterium]
MTARAEAWLWIVQRATAAVLAVAVAVHLATIIYAVHTGLSAAAVLARTQGNPWWLGFYLVFVLAAALHAGVGLRTILREMTPWRGPSLDGAAACASLFLLIMGWRAAIGLFA